MSQGHRIADLGVGYILDPGNDKADLAGCQFADLTHDRGKDPHLECLVGAVGRHQLDLVALLHNPVKKPYQDDHPLVLVIPGIEQQRLERSSGVACGGRNLLYDLFQNLVSTDPFLGAGQHRVMGIDTDDLLDLFLDTLRLGSRKVDFVQHREDFKIVVKGQIHIGQGLGLDPLGCVHYQQPAFAGRQRAGDLIGEVNVPRSIDQIEDILTAVVGRVIQTNGLGLDGNAPLPLQVHLVKELVLFFPVGKRSGEFEQPVGQGGLAMVDMGDDRKIANSADIHEILR